MISISPTAAKEWLVQDGRAGSILYALLDTEECNPGVIFVWLGVESSELYYSLTPLGEALFDFAVACELRRPASG